MKTSLIYNFLLVVFIGSTNSLVDASCAPSSVTFEKIIGKVPSRVQAFHRLEISTTDSHLSGSRSYNVIEECAKLCRTEKECTAFYVDSQNSSCHVTNAQSSVLDVDFNDVSLVESGDVEHFYFRKTCLKGHRCRKTWAFIVQVGMRPKQTTVTERLIKDVSSRDLCQQYCFVETKYNCRSATYYPQSRACALNSNSLRTKPENYAMVLDPDSNQGPAIYMENTCVTVPKKCDFRSGFLKSKPYIDKIFWKVNKKRCAELCLQADEFLCTAYKFDIEDERCDLMSVHIGEDDVTDKPTPTNQHKVYHRHKCAHVVMKCDARSMTAVISVEPTFKGRVYAITDPHGCYSVPTYKSQDEIFLTMPLWGQNCHTKHMGNGTFRNSIIIQEHPYIVRQTDKRVDVFCDYDVVTQKLRSGKEVLEDEDLTEIQSTVTGVVPTPKIKLQIVDEAGQEVSSGVTLGQKLRLNIQMLDNSVYGIFGRGLVARSGDEEDNIPLINDLGCPVEPSVFPPLQVIQDKNAGHKTLTSSFEAFKFATNPVVRFELTISFCLDQCPPVNCQSSNEVTDNNYESYGRRRRRAVSNAAKAEFVTDVTMHKTLFVIPSVAVVPNANPARDKQDDVILDQGSNTPDDQSEVPGPPIAGICLSKPIMYTLVCIAAILQLFTLVCCFLSMLRPYRSNRRGLSTPSSLQSEPLHSSVSSRTRLFQSSMARLYWKS